MANDTTLREAREEEYEIIAEHSRLLAKVNNGSFI